jgi:hypothetical protein
MDDLTKKIEAEKELKQARQNSLNTLLNRFFNVGAIIIIILLLVLSYFLVLTPKFEQTLLAIQASNDQQQKIYSEEKKKLNNLKDAIAAYQKINPIDRQRIDAILPPNYSKEQLYGEIEELVNQNGFQLQNLAITKDSEIDPNKAPAAPATTTPSLPAGVGTISIDLQINAIDYAGLKNLIIVLENHLRLMDIDSLNLSPDGKTAELKVLTYYYKK